MYRFFRCGITDQKLGYKFLRKSQLFSQLDNQRRIDICHRSER